MTMRIYHHLSFEEREQLVVLFAKGYGLRAVARNLGRDHSTIVRELDRTRANALEYSAIGGQKYARKKRKKARRSKKIENNTRLKKYIHKKLKLRWSPQQIAETLKRIYRGDKQMQISHESIYTYIYIYIYIFSHGESSARSSSRTFDKVMKGEKEDLAPPTNEAKSPI